MFPKRDYETTNAKFNAVSPHPYSPSADVKMVIDPDFKPHDDKLSKLKELEELV